MAKSRRKRSRRVVKKSKFHRFTSGTVWFLAIIVLALIGSSSRLVGADILWLLLGIFGAIVAIQNIRKKEEMKFIAASSAFLIIVIYMQVTPTFLSMSYINNFVLNLGVGFGTALFVVALALVTKLCLDK